MARPAADDFWTVRVACITEDQAAINVLNYKIGTVVGGGVTDADAAATFDALFAPLYKALLSEEAEYYGVAVQRFFPTPRTVAIPIVASRGAGSVTGDMLPGQVSGIISLVTDFAGRKYRGRMYIPFPGEADNVDHIPTSSYETRLNSLAVAVVTPVVVTAGGDSAEFRPQIYHRGTSTSDSITGSNSKRLWATQRRRGDFGQRNMPPF